MIPLRIADFHRRQSASPISCIHGSHTRESLPASACGRGLQLDSTCAAQEGTPLFTAVVISTIQFGIFRESTE